MKESLTIAMAQNMKETLKMESLMERESTARITYIVMKDSIIMGKKMDLEKNFKMVQSMKENGKITKNLGTEKLNIQQEVLIKVIF